jgi:hypothetical protein
LNKELLPVTKVAGQPVAFVRFVETSVLNPPHRLSAAMAATTLTRECSLTTPKLQDEQPHSICGPALISLRHLTFELWLEPGTIRTSK